MTPAILSSSCARRRSPLTSHRIPNRRSTIDGRTTGHPGYAISQGLYSSGDGSPPARRGDRGAMSALAVQPLLPHPFCDFDDRFVGGEDCAFLPTGDPAHVLAPPLGAAPEGVAYLARNRRFESISLQRRVTRELVSLGTAKLRPYPSRAGTNWAACIRSSTHLRRRGESRTTAEVGAKAWRGASPLSLAVQRTVTGARTIRSARAGRRRGG
jgi:hypothetical protein